MAENWRECVNLIMSRLSENVSQLFTEEVVKKLQHKRISTNMVFMDTNSELLAKITGLPFRQILTMKDSILAKFASKIRTGDKFYAEILRDGAIVPTGISKLDNLLNGGLYTGSMYELCGLSSCGKSQICMTVATNVSALLHTLNQPVLFIDTKGDFSADRIVATITKGSVNQVLTRIGVTQPKTAYELITFLHDFIKRADEKTARLLVVDSLAALFYQLLGDPNESASLLSSVRSLLAYIANEMHVAVLLTNLTTTWLGADSEEVHKASMGKFWAHVPTTRFTVTRLSSSDILLTVTKSSTLGLGSSITLSVSETGVR